MHDRLRCKSSLASCFITIYQCKIFDEDTIAGVMVRSGRYCFIDFCIVKVSKANLVTGREGP
jgi:hypothetical protein